MTGAAAVAAARLGWLRAQEDGESRPNLIGFIPLPAVMALPLNGIAACVLTLWPVPEATGRTMDRGCFERGIKGMRLRPIG